MKNLALSISTTGDDKSADGTRVSLTAVFPETAEGIAFHAKLAALCSAYSDIKMHEEPGYVTWGRRLLLAPRG